MSHLLRFLASVGVGVAMAMNSSVNVNVSVFSKSVGLSLLKFVPLQNFEF